MRYNYRLFMGSLTQSTKNSISTSYPENYPEWRKIVQFGVLRTRYIWK